MTHYLLICFDRLLSLFFLIILLPFILIILLIVFLNDFNSPLFTQKRVGKNLAIFTIYKIRSMRIERLPVSSYKTTQVNDERITSIGYFIRKYSLDELPQLINILQGHMSFVGPRPVTIHEEVNFSKEHWKLRHSVKPGLSGLAQIYKPKDIFEQQMLERLTIENSSFIFYFKVILKTLKVFNKNI
jgi:lipopolysaccharide/colanic/teichoic acid biosynthesis glycosyltransferase